MARGQRQFFRPTGQLILPESQLVQVTMEQGKNKPHDTNLRGDKLRILQGGSSALAAPSVADGGAAEFDVSITGSGPWDILFTWLAAGCAALARGVTMRTLTITSAGAANSPLAIPVRFHVF